MSTDLFHMLNYLQKLIDDKRAELEQVQRFPFKSLSTMMSCIDCTANLYQWEYRHILSKLTVQLSQEICGISKDVSGIVGEYVGEYI